MIGVRPTDLLKGVDILLSLSEDPIYKIVRPRDWEKYKKCESYSYESIAIRICLRVDFNQHPRN